MLTFTGKYNTADVMIDSLDEETIKQIYRFINNEAFTNPIKIMPDVHAGKGAVIGFTMEMTDKVIPNVIGVDIGCGMLTFSVDKNKFKKWKLEKLDKEIRQRIPFDKNVRNTPIDLNREFSWGTASNRVQNFIRFYNKKYEYDFPQKKIDYGFFVEACVDIEMDLDRALKSIGSLGGGNHFLEISESENTKDIYVTIHSGSRQFGLKVANYWQKKAGKGEMAYLEGENAYKYLIDMILAQQYASLNRRVMMFDILDVLNCNTGHIIETVHNYIYFYDMIIRKGAVAAHSGTQFIVPFNMEDGILICEGKGNKDWNFSAPHGAGRKGSRRWAKESLSEEHARKSMKKKGIYCSTLPLDEARGAYKSSKIIEDSIEPTAEIVDRLKPIMNCKA